MVWNSSEMPCGFTGGATAGGRAARRQPWCRSTAGIGKRGQPTGDTRPRPAPRSRLHGARRDAGGRFHTDVEPIGSVNVAKVVRRSATAGGNPLGSGLVLPNGPGV